MLHTPNIKHFCLSSDVYHDECGGYHEYIASRVFSTLGDIMSTLGVFSTMGVIMCTQWGIPRCMWRVIMSTLGDVQYT